MFIQYELPLLYPILSKLTRFFLKEEQCLWFYSTNVFLLSIEYITQYFVVFIFKNIIFCEDFNILYQSINKMQGIILYISIVFRI